MFSINESLVAYCPFWRPIFHIDGNRSIEERTVETVGCSIRFQSMSIYSLNGHVMFHYTNTNSKSWYVKNLLVRCVVHATRAAIKHPTNGHVPFYGRTTNSDNISAKPSICIVIVMKPNDRIDWQPLSQILPYLVSSVDQCASASDRSQPLHETHKILFLSKEKS